MPAPLIVSCGAPAGIGPEIAAKAWDALRDVIPFVWLGDPAHLPVGTPFQVISDMADTAGMRDAMPVMSIPFAAAAVPGKPDLSNAEGVIAAIRRGVELVQVDEASALCTAPINKKVLIDGAGFHYPGHTEFLEALTGSGRAVMMLASDRLRVVPATIHIALEDVPEVLTHALLRETIQITAIDLTRRFGIDDPRIAVAGLHPHAGEGGTMGRQEGDWIAGLIADMARGGLKVTGSWPADTLFHPEARKGYDAVIAMYHDQALIPIKTLDFDKGVNTTLGLPFIRTSPDHGTAFDIAGHGIANPTSMIEALRMAWKMAGG